MMRATYDREGLNSDPSNFLYQEADDFNVVLDTAGPGSVYFVTAGQAMPTRFAACVPSKTCTL